MIIIYFVAIIAIFYFLAIRPQQKQRRAHQELLASLKKGDRIGTAAGIYGTVKRIDDNIVSVEVAKGVTMKINRRAITEILNKSTSEGRAAAPATTTRRAKAIEAETEDVVSEENGAVEEADTDDEES
jgi:preprotein translocase subunit YajC